MYNSVSSSALSCTDASLSDSGYVKERILFYEKEGEGGRGREREREGGGKERERDGERERRKKETKKSHVI